MMEIFSDIAAPEEETAVLPKEYGIDFKTGRLTGEVVTGAEALKVWCYFALKTARYRYRAFSHSYGSQTDDLIGKSYGKDYTDSEIKRMISECLCCHPNISGCEGIETQFDSGTVSVSLRLVTDFGTAQFNADVEGD